VSTAYRDQEGALRERVAQLEVELEALRARSRELREAEAAEQRIATEVAALRARLEELRGPTLQLENLRIASPCKADWSQMVGDDRVRFCGQCNKNVYDLSGMRRDEATAMIRERSG
jgi:predicted nuclease with TOPRIM domain